MISRAVLRRHGFSRTLSIFLRTLLSSEDYMSHFGTCQLWLIPYRTYAHYPHSPTPKSNLSLSLCTRTPAYTSSTPAPPPTSGKLACASSLNLSPSTPSYACALQSWMRVCALRSMTSLGTRSLFWRLSCDEAGSRFHKSLQGQACQGKQ
jgi:hypothetical protein